MTQPLSRRKFLVTSSACLASSTAIRGASFAATETNKKAVKIGMVRGTYAPKPLIEKFRLLAQLGFDGVELDSPNRWSAEEVRAAKQATGLEIPGVVDSVHWQKRLNDKDPAVRKQGIAALQTALRDAKAYGATSVLLVPGRVTKQDSYEDCYRLSQAAIREVLPLAKELKIHIAIENVWNDFLLSPIECARYVDEFESPWIGVHFDIGNVVKLGWPEHWIRTLGKRILKLDVKEYQRKQRTFAVPLLEGDCDYPAVMQALREIGYKGWFTAEIRGGGADYLKDVAARMDKILAFGREE